MHGGQRLHSTRPLQTLDSMGASFIAPFKVKGLRPASSCPWVLCVCFNLNHFFLAQFKRVSGREEETDLHCPGEPQFVFSNTRAEL